MRLLSGRLAVQVLSPASQPPSAWWPMDSGTSLRHWLWSESHKWAEEDEVFAAQRAVGLTELRAGPSYEDLKARHNDAVGAYQACTDRPIIESKENNLTGGSKAIAGLQARFRLDM